MNKAITDGVLLMPPTFAGGLDVWSSGNGTPGSDSYENATNAAFVPADQDFSGCLEVQKTGSVQRLRFVGETSLLPGCYLQIRARVKAISGNLPNVRIAAWAGGAGGAHVGGVTETGPSTTLNSYGDVVEVTAIVGAGARGGVDMVWGRDALYGHFGLDLTGPTGGVVRIDDIEITDITSAFLRDMLNMVDVRDYGAIGDGMADDSAAFEAADTDANGRRILVPAGTFHLASGASLASPVEFQGNVTMPDDQMLLLTKSYDLPTYIAAFGDEELAFRKAFQALLNNSDHESLDLGGRKISVSEPIDMAAAVPNKPTYATRRVIRNGQFDTTGTTGWETGTTTSLATYYPADARTLSNVANIANIPVGSLVEGNGVGREIYVKSKDIAAGELTLNAGLYDADGTQTFTFKSFKYMLDFSGFTKLNQFALNNIEFQCNSKASAIRLAPAGATFAISDCFISRPRDRGISSIGGGCQGMLIDRCQFLSSEDSLDVQDRVSIAFNSNSNDVKIRNNRATRFRHFGVVAGFNSVVIGNHFFQGDNVTDGVRTAGLVLVNTYSSTTITGNYIDNCFVEWTNEQDPTPDFSTGFSFSSMSITDNIFLSGDVAPWFSYFVIKPFGAGHFLNGLTVTGNKFRSVNGTIDRAERVDTSFASLDFGRTKGVTYQGNTYHNVDAKCASPLRLRYEQVTAANTWTVDAGGELPFQARARSVDGLVARDEITTAGGATRFGMPFVRAEQGANKDQVDVVWEEAVKGTVDLLIRIDK